MGNTFSEDLDRQYKNRISSMYRTYQNEKQEEEELVLKFRRKMEEIVKDPAMRQQLMENPVEKISQFSALFEETLTVLEKSYKTTDVLGIVEDRWLPKWIRAEKQGHH